MFEVRPYQTAIVKDSTDMFNGEYRRLDNSFEVPIRSVMVESACGSGKTAMGHMVAKTMRARHPDLAIGWIAHRKTLLSQAASENRRLGFNVDDIHYTSMFDHTPEKILEARENKKLLLVVDECQHDGASSMAHLHNLLKPEFILGLSATPYRTDKIKLCFEKVVRNAGIHQLIGDGYLSKFDLYSIPEWSPKEVAEAYIRDPERWGKSAFYFLTYTECAELHRLLGEAGFNSEVVTGNSDCDDQIARFESGECPRLINCLKLTEGFNCPDMKTVFVRDGSKGPTVQIAGRVLRKHSDHPVKQIVQSRQTIHPFTLTANPVHQFLWESGEWLTVGSSERVDVVALQTLRQLAESDVKMPKFIQQRQKAKSKMARPWDSA